MRRLTGVRGFGDLLLAVSKKEELESVGSKVNLVLCWDTHGVVSFRFLVCM